MSCCGGKADEKRKKSRELDRQLREDGRRLDGEIKLLLLGCLMAALLLHTINWINTQIRLTFKIKVLGKVEKVLLQSK
jgi:hypothetical protein